jgi:hypothetical protein
LSLVSASAEWSGLIASYRDGALLQADPRKNYDWLAARLWNSDPYVRWNAIDLMAELNRPKGWEALGHLLSDSNVAERVAGHIVSVRYPSLLGAALRVLALPDVHPEQVVWPFRASPWYVNISDQEARALFKHDDIWIDRYVLPQVWLHCRLGLIEDVVAVLNERPSLAAKVAVEQLILGPWPFEQ